MQNIEIMLETCLGTSNYPRVTIWGIGMAYFGHSVAKPPKSRNSQVLGTGKKKVPSTVGLQVGSSKDGYLLGTYEGLTDGT